MSQINLVGQKHKTNFVLRLLFVFGFVLAFIPCVIAQNNKTDYQFQSNNLISNPDRVSVFDFNRSKQVNGIFSYTFSTRSETQSILQNQPEAIVERPDVQWMRSGVRFGLWSLDYSPDGQTIATIENSFRVVKFWRVSDGILIRTLNIQSLRDASDAKIKYLADGQHILVICVDIDRFNVKLIRISDGAIIRTFGDEGRISTFELLSDGTLVMGTGLSGGRINTLKFFNFSTGAFIRDVTNITYVNTSGTTVQWGTINSFSSSTADGKLVVSRLLSSGSSEPAVIDTEGRLLGYLPAGSGINRISADGNLLGGFRVYRFSQLCPGTQVNCNPSFVINGLTDIAFSADGQTIAASNSNVNEFRFYRTSDFSLIRSMPANAPREPLFSPDSQSVVFSSLLDDSNNFTTTRILRVSDGTLIRRLESHYSNVQNVLFSPDGLTALSLSIGFPESNLTNNFESVIRVWNAVDGTLIRSIPTGEVAGNYQSNRNLAFSPDGQLIFFKHDGEGIQIRNLSDGTLVRTLPNNNSCVIGFVLSPNGQFIGCSNTLFRVSDGTIVWSSSVGGGNSLAFTPDGQGVFTGSRLLNVSNGSLIRNFTTAVVNIYSATVSPDGQNVAFSGAGSSFSDGITEIRRISDGALIRTFSQIGLGRHYAAKFSPNNQQIAVAGDEAVIRLYNLTDGTLARLYDEEVPTPSANPLFANIQSFEFSPDGSHFSYGRNDTTMVVAGNPCLYSISQSSISTGASSGNGSFNIGTATGCAWQAVSNSPWLTVSNSGNGNGTINFTFSANTGTSRTGQISVGGKTFTVNQNGVVSVTVQSNPVGRSFIVDGTTYTTTQPFTWESGSLHTISTTSLQSGAVGTQYVWSNWSDGGTISHTVSPIVDITYTANFTTQYQLTMSAGSGGTVSPSNGFYNAGQSVQITATPNSGFTFANWTGTGSGSYSGTNNPATVTMNAPITQTASFNVQCDYTLNPTGANISAAGGNANFAVTAPSGCAWTAISNAVWVTTTSTGNGNGTVNYTVTANTGAARNTTITVGGQIFSINQSPLTINRQSDFDGDGKTDISIFRPSNGQWWYQQSGDNVVKALTFGVSTDKITPGDYDGDRKTDIAFFRPSTGEWFVLRSSNLTFFAAPFGTSTDKPAPGDFDGDGKTDFAVFRPSNATWFILRTSDMGVQTVPFGTSTDIPTVADYDGDGKSDIAIYRPTGSSGGGEWWLLRSSNGSVFATPFGTSTDKPVQGDYTGDGKADCAYWKPSTGEWFVLRSESLTYYAAPFGANGDIPVAGDYDGDGKFDFGVFRPTSVTWFINKSTGGTLIQAFGATGDIPVPSAYVP